MTPVNGLAPTGHAPQPVVNGSVGVLLVHGMGSARPGDTLRSLGEPLLRTIRLLRASDPSLHPSCMPVTELDLSGGPDGPAHVVVDADGAHWVVAECHWDECFRLPSYSVLCSWLLLAVPWTASSYARGKVAERHGRRRQQWASRVRDATLATAAGGVALVLAPVLAGLVALVLVLLLPLSKLPVPVLQRTAKRVVAGLSGSLGDVYVLMSDGFDRDLVEQRLRRDLDYLLEEHHCEKVVLVAHSAGSRLCHQALQTSTRPQDRRVELLVTYGQAVWRADATAQLAQSGRGRAAVRWSLLSAVGFLLGGHLVTLQIVGLAWWPYGTWGPLYSWYVAGAALLALGIVAGLRCLQATRGTGSRDVSRLLPLRVLGKDVLWRDYVASADPVPDGLMVTRADRAEHPSYQGVRLHNERSVMRDHTSYTTSDVYLRALAQDVWKVAGHPELRGSRQARDHRWAQRRLRTRWLSAARNSVLLAGSWVLLAAALRPGQVLDDGSLQRAGGADQTPAVELAGWLGDVLPASVARVVLGPGADQGAAAWRLGLLGVATVMAVLYASYSLLRWSWRRWDRRESSGQRGGRGGFLSAWVTLVVVLLLAAPVLAQPFTWGSSEVWRTGGRSIGYWEVISGGVAVGCLLLVVGTISKRLDRDEPGPGDDPWDDADPRLPQSSSASIPAARAAPSDSTGAYATSPASASTIAVDSTSGSAAPA